MVHRIGVVVSGCALYRWVCLETHEDICERLLESCCNEERCSMLHCCHALVRKISRSLQEHARVKLILPRVHVIAFKGKTIFQIANSNIQGIFPHHMYIFDRLPQSIPYVVRCLFYGANCYQNCTMLLSLQADWLRGTDDSDCSNSVQNH